jgi:hypothetical protein
MTILSVVKDVALKIGIDQPDAVYTSTERDMLEMQGLIDEVATDILECFDWQALMTKNTITGDGSSEAHSLPSDYKEMGVGNQVWSSKWTEPLQHITNLDEWLEYEVVPYTFAFGTWAIFGDQIHILPVMASTETAKFFYKSNLIVQPDSGSNKAAFDTDTDTFRLNEKLLRYGLIWKWKSKKGMPYEEDLADYEKLKSYLMDTDKGSKPTIATPRRRYKGSQWAFPSTVGGV